MAVSAKYWVANNPNSAINDAKAQKLAELSATTVSVAELNALDASSGMTAVMTVGAEAGEVIPVTIQLNDGDGGAMAASKAVFGYLSANADGSTIATISGLTVAIGTDGLLQPIVANSSFYLISESDGDIDITVTDASGGTLTNYLVLVMPDGGLVISDAITFT
jgi:hypothetical protein|tara:strand:- start:708 stop:1199 length:492 start_codon:yes stop_codon:yes gene_type:complete